MDKSKLLGTLPSTANTVLAKNLGTGLKPPPQANALVLFWLEMKMMTLNGPHPTGATWFALFAMIGLALLWIPSIIVSLPLFLYLQIAVWLLQNCPEDYARLPSLGFRKDTTPAPVPPFKEATALLMKSPDQVERNSIMIGTVAGTNWPVMVPIATFMRHVQVDGPTGAYKTWLVEMCIIAQQISRGTFVNVVCCGKGEKAVANFLKKKADDAGLPFYFVTIDDKIPSMTFNPFDQSCFEDTDEKISMILQTLGLYTGDTAHGVSFWQSMIANRARRQMHAFPTARSYRELRKLTEKLSASELAAKMNMSAKEMEFGIHFQSEISNLGDAPCLNAEGPKLDIMQAIQKPCVVVFMLPANVNKALSAKIRRQLLYILNLSARKLEDEHPPIFFSIEEAQESLDESELPILKTCRDQNIGVTVIHQSLEDLDKLNMRSDIVDNYSISIHLGARDGKIRDHLEKTAGKTKEEQISTYLDEDGGMKRLVDAPRLGTDDFDDVNSETRLAIVSIHNGGGYAQFRHPFVCQLLGYPTTHEEYLSFRKAPWPRIEGGVTRKNFEAEPKKEPAKPTDPKEQAAGMIAALAAFRNAHM